MLLFLIWVINIYKIRFKLNEAILALVLFPINSIMIETLSIING